jgi:hypothetical protein
MELDLGEVLGASGETSPQVLTLYIPNKDRSGREFGTQRRWVLRAAELLAHLGGGVTIMPPTEGGWLNEETGTIIWENPVQVYSYIKPDRFMSRLGALRRFLHDLGRETGQGEVAFEFDGLFFRITEFDEPQEVHHGGAHQDDE